MSKYKSIKNFDFDLFVLILRYIIMESPTLNNDINAIKEARKLFNELKSNLSREEMDRIREKLYKKEVVYNFLKEKEQKGSLANRQKNVLRNIESYLKNFKKDLEKLNKYEYHGTYGLNYLFNELSEEDYYEPTEIKSAFDGGCTQYESRGIKDGRLSIDEYFDIIRPYLGDVIDIHKKG